MKKNIPTVISSESGMSRRKFMTNLGVVTASATLIPSMAFSTPSGTNSEAAAARFVYVGTYSYPNTAPGGIIPSTAVGIYVYKMDANGELTLVQEVIADNPSFLAVDPTMNYLYSVNELGEDLEGNPLGRVSSYNIDPSTGTITLINSALTNGVAPCHCSVHPSGGYLFAANYVSGSFLVYPLNGDGSIGEITDLIQNTGNGTGPDPSRQEGPHAHMMLTNPGGQYVFGVDLGADKVLSWKLDMELGTLTPGTVPYANAVSGGGPRHMVFNPNDLFAYILNELSSSIDVYTFDSVRGAFNWIQNVSTLQYDVTNTASEIRIHPTGNWLYATNRDTNTIAMFDVNSISGKLTPTGWKDTLGNIPRGMNIDPSGSFLIVGNQNSDSILVFTINSMGELTLVQQISSPVPVDFVFGPAVPIV